MLIVAAIPKKKKAYLDLAEGLEKSTARATQQMPWPRIRVLSYGATHLPALATRV